MTKAIQCIIPASDDPKGDTSALWRGDLTLAAPSQQHPQAMANSGMFEMDCFLQASNRMLRPHMHAAASAIAPELRSGMHGLADGAAATLDSLLDLHDVLLERVPDRAAAAATEAATDAAAAKSNGKKRGRNASDKDESLSGERP